MTPPTIAALGRATTDFFGAGLRLGDLSRDNSLREVSVQVGGGAAIAAVTAAAMGSQVRFCAKIAKDFIGAFIEEALESAGIDTSLVVKSAGRMSPFSFTAVGDRSDRHRFGTTGDVATLDPSEVSVDALLAGASALLIDGTEPAVQAIAADAAGRRDVPTVLDVGDMRSGIGELVAIADVLIASERVASEIAPRGELQDSLIELQQLGPSSVVITMGELGSIGLRGDQLVRQPAHPIAHITDTSGAGHVYHGAFAAALVNGEPFARCMQAASIAAGLSCTELGALATAPTREMVLAHMS